MNSELAHTIILGAAILGATLIAAVWLHQGGDGAALNGYVAVIMGVVGLEFGKNSGSGGSTGKSGQ